MIAATRHSLRQQVHLLTILIFNPLTYDGREHTHVCRAVARVLRIRLECVGRFCRRCYREGASLLRSASEACEPLRGERPPCRAHRDHGSLQSTNCKSAGLGENPSCRSRRSSRRRASGVTVPYRVQTTAQRWSRGPNKAPKGRPLACLYLLPRPVRAWGRRRITLNMDRRACVALAVAGSSRDGKGQGL